MNANTKRANRSSMGAFEAEPPARRKTTPSPVTPQPSHSFGEDTAADLPKRGEPAAKDQMVDARASESTVVTEKASSTAPSKDEKPQVEDHARQSTGVSDSEKIHGKTMALSSFDFDKLLDERKNKKSDDS